MREADPVEELHNIRKAIMKEAGGTPVAYARYYFEMGRKRLAASKPVRQNKSRRASAKPAM
jgi:hypothetical protein